MGIEGLEEGTDYTYSPLERKTNDLIGIDEFYCNGVKCDNEELYKIFKKFNIIPDGILTLSKECLSSKENEAKNHCYDFYLNFENNIREVMTVAYEPLTDIEYFVIKMGGEQGKRGKYVKTPVKLVQKINDYPLTKCNFTLKYDTNIFEDAYVEEDAIPYGKVSGECDKENGTIKIDFDSLGSESLLGKKEMITNTVNLMLKIKDDAPIGSTLLSLENSKFERNKNSKFYDHKTRMDNWVYDRDLIYILK